MKKYLWERIQYVDLRICAELLGKSAEVVTALIQLEGDEKKIACERLVVEIRAVESTLNDLYGFQCQLH